MVEIFGERVELLFPELPRFDDPSGGVNHRAGIQAAVVDAPLLAARDQARALQDPQVPRNSGRGDAVRRGKIAHRRFAAREVADDAAPDRIGQSREYGVEGRLFMINQLVNYYVEEEAGCQSAGRNFL